MTKIYINELNNPLVSGLREIFKQKGYLLVSDLKDSDLIISFAYSKNNDFISMEGMKNILFNKNYDNKQIIFLSWFNFKNEIKHYLDFLNPEKQECIIMDSSKYRILQLPIADYSLFNSVQSLLDEKQ